MAKDKKSIQPKLIELLNVSPIISAACKSVGVSRATFYRWLEDDKDFAKKIDKSIGIGTESINDLAESKLFQSLKNGEPWAIRFWLNNRSPHYTTPSKLIREIHTNKETFIRSVPVDDIPMEPVQIIDLGGLNLK